MRSGLTVAAGWLADQAVGEPPARVHSVAWFGKGMRRLEGLTYRDSRTPGAVHTAVGMPAAAGVGRVAIRILGRPECLTLGRAIPEAQETGGDPVEAAARSLDGWVLFRGTIVEREWKNTGYMEGFHVLEGHGGFSGKRMKLWFKNENHLSWLGDEPYEPYVASPDLLEVCDDETGEPLVNTYLREGDRVAVVGMRRREVWDSEAGLESLGPAHFGWPEFPFRPIEVLAGEPD